MSLQSIVRRPRLSTLVMTLVTAVFALHGAAQSSGPTTITVNARLVVLDVVVTDKNGKPVEDLTAKDFAVFEDGAPQRIRNFEQPSAHSLPDVADETGADTVYDPSQPRNFGQSPVTVLVLDQLNTHFADSSFARRALHDYLIKQPSTLAQPTTLVTVYDQHFKLLQGFTRNRDSLLKALNSAPTKYAWQLETNGKADYGPLERLDQSLRALEQIAETNSRIPGRKNLIWVGGGFPVPDPAMLSGENYAEVKDTIQHITDVLLSARVTLYAVDPSSSAAGMSEIVTEEQMEFAAAAGDTMATNIDPFSNDTDFDRLGPLTGGRIVRHMNNVADQIGASIKLGASFYTLAYSPTSPSDASAKYRKIRVDCLRPGLTLVTREGYYPESARQGDPGTTAAFDLSTAAEATVPLNGLRVTAIPETSVASGLDNYLVRVSAPGLTWKLQADGTSIASVYILAAVMDKKDKMVAHVVHPMTATAKVTANLHDEERTADFSFSAPASSRGAKLRFVVRDSTTGRMGSVDIAPIKSH